METIKPITEEGAERRRWQSTVSRANVVLFDEAGFPIAAGDWRKVTSDTIWIDHIEVRKDMRQKGIGKKLLQKILDESRVSGIHTCRVLGEQLNADAVWCRKKTWPNTVFMMAGDPVPVDFAADNASINWRVFAVSFV